MSGRYFDRKEVSVGIVVIVSEIEINEGGNLNRPFVYYSLFSFLFSRFPFFTLFPLVSTSYSLLPPFPLPSPF